MNQKVRFRRINGLDGGYFEGAKIVFDNKQILKKLKITIIF